MKRGKLNIFIIPGQKLFRYEEKFYRRLFPITDVIVFVIDSADKKRFNEVKEYFDYVMKMMKKYGKENCKLLILAHKQDLPNCANAEEIAELLGVQKKIVLETSVKIPRTMLHLLMTLHGIKVEPFSAIAIELKMKTNAETVLMADKDCFTYAVIGDEDQGMKWLATLMNLRREVGDLDMAYFMKGNLKTIMVRQLVNNDTIFFLVINSPENAKTIINAMKKALNAAKEEYKKRWEL